MSLIDVFGTSDLIHVYKMEKHGGIMITVGASDKLTELIKWVETHKHNLEWERTQRAQDPELAHLYDQYQTYLNLKLSGT